MTTINEISNHIMGYFNGTLDAFGYTAQSVNEISNPDESYMGTLNLQFRDYPIRQNFRQSNPVLPKKRNNSISNSRT